MRSVEDVRDHLIAQLNQALRRPGMYGGWAAVTPLVTALAFVDDFPEARIRVLDDNSRTPSRFVDAQLPDPDQNLHHALHLPAFHRRGWFRPDRALTPDAHADLLATLDPWLADRRRQCDVVAAFGRPAWRRGNVLAYATDDPADAMVLFVAHNDAVSAAWSAEDFFPKGLRLTTAGKELLADRPALSEV